MVPSLQVPSTGDLRSGFVVLDCFHLLLYLKLVSLQGDPLSACRSHREVLSDTAAELSQLRDTAAPRPTEEKQGQHYLPTLCLAVWHPLAGTPGPPSLGGTWLCLALCRPSRAGAANTPGSCGTRG